MQQSHAISGNLVLHTSSTTSSFLFLVVRMLLVAMPGAPSSFLLLVVRPGAPSSVLNTDECRDVFTQDGPSNARWNATG